MRQESLETAVGLALSFWLWGNVTTAAEVSVQMRLSTARPSVEYGEQVVVHVELENVGSGYWVLYPHFFPYSISGAPRSELTFAIVDSKGRTVPAIEDEGEDNIDEKVVAVTGPWDYLRMGSANSLGFTLSLTAGQHGNYAFPGRGHYTIRARLVTDARTWLQRRIQSGRVASQDVHFDLQRVLEGTLESNAIEVDLQ